MKTCKGVKNRISSEAGEPEGFTRKFRHLVLAATVPLPALREIKPVSEILPAQRNLLTEMYLVPQMATALVFFIYVSNDGLEQANAQYYAGVNLHREIRMCGPMLTNTLELVCQGRFNPMSKKAQDGGTRSQDWTSSDRENFAIFPFRSRRNALAFNGAGTFRRRTRNVADECCYLKPCTLAEMSHYCE